MSLTIPSTAAATKRPLNARPSVALIMPFDPKMMAKTEIEGRVQRMLATAEKELLGMHPAGEAMPVVRKLQQLIRKLNGSTHKVGAALFVSEEMSRVAYLDFPVEERVLVDEPFLVRDLADCRPASQEFLVLLLNAKESRMYLKNESGLKLIKSNTPQTVYAYINEVPERTANFSDPARRREVVLNKFLHHMDQGLGAVLHVYPLPVFVIAPERVAGHFARMTFYDEVIAGYLHKDPMDIAEGDIPGLLEPMLLTWRETKERMLLRQMEKAAAAGKLVCGLHEARKAAGCRNSRLIIVERCQASDGTFCSDGEVDELVLKVLENGGNVEKMEPEYMGQYGPVALIKYY